MPYGRQAGFPRQSLGFAWAFGRTSQCVCLLACALCPIHVFSIVQMRNTPAEPDGQTCSLAQSKLRKIFAQILPAAWPELPGSLAQPAQAERRLTDRLWLNSLPLGFGIQARLQPQSQPQLRAPDRRGGSPKGRDRAKKPDSFHLLRASETSMQQAPSLRKISR